MFYITKDNTDNDLKVIDRWYYTPIQVVEITGENINKCWKCGKAGTSKKPLAPQIFENLRKIGLRRFTNQI